MYQSAHLAKVLKVFTYPGKLSLSVYLTQSIVLSIVFLGIGEVYITNCHYTNLIPLHYLFMAYNLQAVTYLKYFKMGPFEWIWRKVTYLK